MTTEPKGRAKRGSLPAIVLDVYGVGEKGFNIHGAGACLTGEAYLFKGELLMEVLREQMQNLDGFLTSAIGTTLVQKKVKTPLLVYQYNDGGYIRVTVSAQRQPLMEELMKAQGWVAKGSEHIPDTIPPLLYYDGKRLFRTHLILPSCEKKRYLVADLGMLLPCIPVVGPTQKWRFEQIKSDPVENWDYSAVPETSEQEVKTHGSQIVVHHVRFDLKRSELGFNALALDKSTP